ncbi:MAG: hypothetical protein DRN03_05610 [Thermoplasmata archaeon]|nr:MAG: hypothetical protein DRN03_05610 [Thermoplasmata archaeon]
MAIIQIDDHTYEVIADCKKCRKITPHKWIIFYGYGKDWEIIRYEEFICLNCGFKEEFEHIEGRL